jgi:hypothetical protein
MAKRSSQEWQAIIEQQEVSGYFAPLKGKGSG